MFNCYAPRGTYKKVFFKTFNNGDNYTESINYEALKAIKNNCKY